MKVMGVLVGQGHHPSGVYSHSPAGTNNDKSSLILLDRIPCPVFSAALVLVLLSAKSAKNYVVDFLLGP